MLEAVKALTPPAGSVYERRRQTRGGSGGVNALALLAQHPPLARAFLGFNRHLLYESELDERLRELAVLRVAWRLGAAYEWGQHVPVALDCGVTRAEVERLLQDDPGGGWSNLERALLAATDQLLAGGDIDDTTWRALASELDHTELLDLVFTVGGYATLAMAFNAARLPLDPDLEGFRPDARE